ncbi:MAG: hypothetical protein FJ221_19010 [Lentisphaerae bacterium]|nr:hypothetical protein [Lentisphaerota bacterium]
MGSGSVPRPPGSSARSDRRGAPGRTRTSAAGPPPSRRPRCARRRRRAGKAIARNSSPSGRSCRP